MQDFFIIRVIILGGQCAQADPLFLTGRVQAGHLGCLYISRL